MTDSRKHVVPKTQGGMTRIKRQWHWDKVGPLYYFSEMLKKIRILFLEMQRLDLMTQDS